MVLLSVGQHQSLWPTIKTLSPDSRKLQSELASNSVEEIIFFTLLIFDIFLKKHLHFFIRYIMDFSKYTQNATRQYQTLFYFIVNHHIDYSDINRAMQENKILFKNIRLYCNRFDPVSDI